MTVGAFFVTQGDVEQRMAADDAQWSSLAADVSKCPETEVNKDTFDSFQIDLSAWKVFVEQGVSFLGAATVNDELTGWEEKLLNWHNIIVRTGCRVPEPAPTVNAPNDASTTSFKILAGVGIALGLVLLGKVL